MQRTKEKSRYLSKITFFMVFLVLISVKCESFASGSCSASDLCALSSAKNPSGKSLIKIAQIPQGQVPEALPAIGSAAATLKRARQLIDMGHLQEALSAFQDYSRIKPSDAAGFFWAGVCYDEMGNYPAAAQSYRDSISRAEQNAMDSCEIRMNLGNVLLKQNDFDQSIETYKRALDVNPQYALAELNLARAYIAKGDYAKALEALAKSEELHFSGPQVPYYKAKALLGLGRKDEAGVIVQRLLQVLPAEKQKQEIQEEFRSCLPAQK